MGRQVIRYPLQARLLSVRDVSQLTPRMRRVTFYSEDLVGFKTGSPTDHVKLFFPEPGSSEPVMPAFGPDGIKPPEDGAPKPISRDFSIRAFRENACEVDIDFVLHGDGLAASWARNAVPGNVVGMGGPRGSQLVPDGYGWYLLAGDETALPAIGRWLDEAPAGQRIFTVVEVNDAFDELNLTSSADVMLAWVHRNGAEPGTNDLLERAIRDLDLPGGNGFAWVAGEAGTLKSIRRYLRNELRMDPETVDVDGYWKRGTTNFDHHTPIEE